MIDLSIDLSRVWQVDLSWNSIGNEGAKAIGAALRVNGALTNLDLRYNDLGEDAKRALTEVNARRATPACIDLKQHQVASCV